MISSSQTQTQFLKYGLLIFGVLVLLIGMISAIQPFDIQVDEYATQESDFLDTIIIFSLGIILVLLHLLVSRHIHYVRIDMQKLVIPNKDPELKGRQIQWSEVESLKRAKFVTPPVYYARNTEGELFIFTTENRQGKYIEVNIPFMSFVYDFSEMGKEVKKIKKAYKI